MDSLEQDVARMNIVPATPTPDAGPSTLTAIPTMENDEENPWSDSGPVHRLETPDPNSLPASILGFQKESETPPNLTVNENILAEFDPVGKETEEWKDQAPIPPLKDPPRILAVATSVPPPSPIPLPAPATISSPSPTSNFPSLAALARSFSLPKHRRPMSVDGAAAVPSPRTLSGFAAQQDAHPPSGLNVEAVPFEEHSTEVAEPANNSQQGEMAVVKDSEPPGDPPFDFQTFLDQMKTRPAEPVNKYLKSFLANFAKRTFTVADQIKIINDFMLFIAKQMRLCDVWKDASDVEFDNAMEGMEKLVMNQVYIYTFTPAIAQTARRLTITTDDLERDRVLAQRIAIFKWTEPRHLDLPPLGSTEEGFLAFAQQELLKVNSYKAPRDKLICILNCCKVIFGLIRHLQGVAKAFKEGLLSPDTTSVSTCPSTTSSSSSSSRAASPCPSPNPTVVAAGADEFLPFLIYVVIKCSPLHLLSNIHFISRFRSPDRMNGEGMYYLSSLEAAVGWVEGLGDWTGEEGKGLNVSKEEFEKNVEKAVREMEESGGSPLIGASVEGRVGSALSAPSTPTRSLTPNPSLSRPFTPDALSLPAVERLLQKTGSVIGRMFNEVVDGVEGTFDAATKPTPPRPNQATRPTTGSGLRENAYVGGSRPHSYAGAELQTPANGAGAPVYQTPYKPRVRRVSPSPSFSSSRSFNDETPSRRGASMGGFDETPSRLRAESRDDLYYAQFAGFGGQREHQAYPGSAPASPHHLGHSHHLSSQSQLVLPIPPQEAPQSLPVNLSAALDTLLQIFPGMDREIVEMVLDANGGDVGRSVEGLLEMSGGQ